MTKREAGIRIPITTDADPAAQAAWLLHDRHGEVARLVEAYRTSDDPDQRYELKAALGDELLVALGVLKPTTWGGMLGNDGPGRDAHVVTDAELIAGGGCENDPNW